MSYPPGPYVLLSSVESAIKSYPTNVDNMLAGVRKLHQYNPPNSQDCSIPQDLEGAINDLVKWKNTGASPSGSTQYYITNVEHALSKALQGQCELHTSKQRMDDLKEAEELLIKVCKYTDQTPNNASHCMLYGVSQIEGLKEWWAKHKPKSERDKKLEKIVCALSLGGTMVPDLIPVAENILKALEE